MADFCITAVQYSKDDSHIVAVEVREKRPKNLGSPRIVPRAFIADLIRLEKATFQTATKTSEGKWKLGAAVSLIADEYLTTERNNTKRDNLGELREL